MSFLKAVNDCTPEFCKHCKLLCPFLQTQSLSYPPHIKGYMRIYRLRKIILILMPLSI